MIHITLEDLYHLSLVFWWIFIEVFSEWYEIRIGLICDISSLYEFEDMIVTLELFLSSIDSGFYSFVIFFVGFIVDTCVAQICGFIFLLECYLETDTICLDEFEFIRFERREEFFKSFCEIMTRIFVYGCSIEIHEEVFESHFFHAFYRHIGISVIEIFSEIGHETVVVVARTIVIDEIGEKSSDPINTCSVFLFFGRIENCFIETTQDRSSFRFDGDDVCLSESQFCEISPGYLTENLLQFPEISSTSDIVIDEFFECRILDFCSSSIECILLGSYIECREYRKIIWMRSKYPLFLSE